MLGYKGMTTFNPKWTAYSFKLFDKKEDAEKYVHEQLIREERFLDKQGFSKVEECEIEKCPNSYCDKFMEAGDRECLSCDHIRADVEYDHQTDVESG